MVQLTLLTPRGNALKYFPFTGSLGLTPVRVEGVVRVRLEAEKTHNQNIRPRKLTVAVRCYESRVGLGRVSAPTCLVEYPYTLWDSESSTEFQDSELPFRITVPVDSTGPSTVSYPDYKIYWRVEAVLDHGHIPGVGNRLIKHTDLPLIRHAVPSPLLRPLLSSSSSYNDISPASSSSSLPLQRYFTITRGRFPILRYGLSIPTESLGPDDLLSVHLTLVPYGPNVTLKSACISLERRIEFLGPSTAQAPISSSNRLSSYVPYDAPAALLSTTSGSLTPTPSTLSRAALSMSDIRGATGPDSVASSSTATVMPSPSTISLPSPTATSSTCTVTPLLRNPLVAPSSSSSSSTSSANNRTLSSSHTVASGQIDGSLFSQSPTYASSRSSLHEPSTLSKTLTLSIPPTPPSGRWSIGESMQTIHTAVSFVLNIRVTLSSPSGTETIDLDAPEEERTVLVSCVNDAQRRVARKKWEECQEAARQRRKEKSSKSVSPNRRGRRMDEKELEVPEKIGAQGLGVRQSSASSSLASASSTSGTSGSISLSASTSSVSSASSSSSNGFVESRPIHPSHYGYMGDSVSANGMTPPSSAPPLFGSLSRPGSSKGSSSKSPFSKSKKTGSGPPTARPSIRRPHTSAGTGSAPPSSFGGARFGNAAAKKREEALVQEAQVRAWEEELERIEAKSRRSSLMMGGVGMRGRAESGASAGALAAQVPSA